MSVHFVQENLLSSFYVLPENDFLYEVYDFTSCDVETAHKGFITYNERLIIAFTDVQVEVRERKNGLASCFNYCTEQEPLRC